MVFSWVVEGGLARVVPLIPLARFMPEKWLELYLYFF